MARKSERPYVRGEVAPTKPRERHDGEMYSRPEPNPFTTSWNKGYDDGFEGRVLDSVEGTKIDLVRYEDGYWSGVKEREGMDRAGSSNT